MQRIIKFLFFICLFSFGSVGFAQVCECTISEVENNTVTPCDLIIGTVDTVETTAELKSAISQANASGGNMTILIADGTYQVATTASYPYVTASNVVFRSLSGNRDDVILTGTGMASVSPLVENGFYLVGDNITIADLTIKEVGNHGIAGQGDNLFVHNVKIQNTYEQMIKGTSAGDGADNGKVQCSLFEYPNGVGPQFYIGGLDIHKGNNWVVSDNIFKNIASPSGSVAEHAIHFWNNSADNIIERNVIINCDRGIGFGLGSSPTEGGIIRNNMIYNDGSNPFNDVGIGLETCPDTKVYNNTIYIEYQNAIEYRFAETVNVDISNNLTNKTIKSRNGGQATLSTNFTSALNSWFVDPSSGNLRLNSNYADVVDQGSNLADVTMDIDQTPRPQAGTFDIGAQEQVQATSIDNVEANKSIVSVFPNPAKNSFTIKAKEASVFNIVIYNNLNQVIATFKDQRLSSPLLIDTSKWQSGIYFCQVAGQNQTSQSTKIVIAK